MTETAPSPFNKTPTGVELAVRLSPRAARDEICGAGAYDDKPVLTATVRAVAHKGQANAALLALIADWAGVKKRDVSLARGAKARLKRIRIAGDPPALAARIERLLADSAGTERSE